MSTKTIHIKLVTPWGVSLMHKELKNWSDVDINKFMDLHYVVIRTSKENFKKPFYFKVVPLKK